MPSNIPGKEKAKMKKSLTLHDKIRLAICILVSLSRLADDIAEDLDTINFEEE